MMCRWRILQFALVACATALAACCISAPPIDRQSPGGSSSAAIPKSLQRIGVDVLAAPDKSGEYITVLYVFNSQPNDIIREVSQLFAVHAAWEPQTYHLILRGTPQALAPALDLVLHLEAVPIDREHAKIFVKHLNHANAAATAATLQSMIANQFTLQFPRPAIVIPDTRTNSVIVATETTYEDKFRSIIEELDRTPIHPGETTPNIRIENRMLVPDTAPAK